MTPTVRETAVLVFSTDAGGQATVRINDPREDITETHLNAATTFFRQANVFEAEIGNVEDLVSVDRVTVTTTPVFTNSGA